MNDSLLALFDAIARHDHAAASRLLAASPTLAVDGLVVGATRLSPNPYFLEVIAHHVYAGDTALHVAAAAHDPEAVSALLALGAEVDAKNRRGAEPIHYAADGGPTKSPQGMRAEEETVRALIVAGANPNALDKSGVAPLHRAVRCRSTGAVRALLAGGAHPEMKNGSGSSPMDLALRTTGRSGSGSAAAREQQAEIIRLLTPK